MESIEQKVKELLELFLYQDTVNRMDSKDKLIKVYRVPPTNIVRVDIKITKGESDQMKPKVNIKSNFSKTIVERVFDESEFMLRNNEILKTTALKFKVSITTVWVDMRKRLPLINPGQYRKISGLIYSHKKGQKGYCISGFDSEGDD